MLHKIFVKAHLHCSLTNLYVGICILELIKSLMQEFIYDYIKNKYGNDSRLLCIDSGSLMYEIKTENAYEDFISDK